MADRRGSRIPQALSFLTNAVTKRRRAEEALRTAKEELEGRVALRTAELEQRNTELLLLESMTRMIGEAEDFESALQIMLREVCESKGWDYGEACVPCTDGEALVCRPVSYAKQAIHHRSWQVTQAIECPSGCGLAGRVWLSKEPEWIEDVSSFGETLFVRSPTVAEAGFKTALAFPVMIGDNVVAVFLLFRLRSEARDEGQIEVLQVIATQLGTILQRKQAQEALRASEERFRLLAENAQDVIFRYRLTEPMGYEYISPAVAAMSGYAPAEWYENRHMGHKLVHPDDRQAFEQMLNELYAGPHDLRWIRKDGTVIWTEQRTTPIHDDSGKLVAVEGVVRDITERKQAEEALRQYERIVSSTTDMLALVDQRCVFLAVNTAYLQAFAKTSDEVIGRTVTEVFGEEFFTTIVRPRAERCLAGENVRFQAWFEFPAAGRKYMDITYSPYRGPNTEVQGFVVAARDITERKQAEEALRESEERFRSLYTATPAMLHSIDREGCILNVSDHWLEVLGYERSETIGRRVVEFLTEESRRYAEDVALPEFWRRGVARDTRLQFVKKDGEIVDILLSAIAEYDSEGNPYRTLAVLTDITERNRADEALRRQQEEQQTILDSVPALIFYKDRENRFLRVNRALVEATGIPRETWEGGSAFDLLPNQAEDYWRDDKAVMESGQALRNIIEPMETPGGTKWYRTDKIPYRDAGGQIVGIIGFSADITEQKRLEQQLLCAREELEGKVERQMLRRNPYGLTFRELVVLHPLVAGRSDKEIATELVISPQTVHKHVANILAKMDAASRTEAATRALREGLLE